MKKLTLLLLFLTSNLFAFTQTNFDIALKDLLQRTVFLQETELYQKIIAFCGKWNKYNGYIGLKVQPSNNGQYVRMNQVLIEDYEEIEAIVQRMKSEICEIYESISQ